MSNIKYPEVKLKECIKLSSGRFLPEKKRIEGVYNVYGGNGISGTHNDYFIEEPTIVIGRVGEYCGCVHVSSSKTWVTDNALYVKEFLKNFDIRYLGYALNKANLNRLANTSGQPSVSQTNILNTSIIIPPIEIQKHIADILDKIQEILSINKQQMEELDNLIKTTFYDMFGDPFDIKNNQNKVPLYKVADIIMGQSPKGDSYNSEGNGTPLLNGPTEFGKIYPTEKQWTVEPKKLCEKGDILFCVRGATAGRMNYADKPYCIGRGLASIRVKEDITKEYLYSYLEVMYYFFQTTSSGSTFININKKQLESIPIIYPTKDKQKLFSKIVTNIEEQKSIVRQSITESQNLFNSLMSRYFD